VLFPLIASLVLLLGCGNQTATSLAAASGPTTTGPTTLPDVSTTAAEEVSVPPNTPPDPAPTTTAIPTTVPPNTLGTEPAVASSGVQGTVAFGPVCPVERIPPDPRCAPRPGAAQIQLLQDGTVAADGTAGADGRFSIAIGPGTYVVHAAATASSPGRGCQADPEQVIVAAGALSAVTVTCDTGIR
jgi:hypothetical protein